MCITCGSGKSHRTTGGKVSAAIQKATKASQKKKKPKTGEKLKLVAKLNSKKAKPKKKPAAK